MKTWLLEFLMQLNIQSFINIKEKLSYSIFLVCLWACFSANTIPLVCHFRLFLVLKSSVTQMGTQHNGGFGVFMGCLLITVIFFSPYRKNCKYDYLRNCISKQKCVLSGCFHILRYHIKTHSQVWLISSVLPRTENVFYVGYWFWILYRQWNVGEVI